MPRKYKRKCNCIHQRGQWTTENLHEALRRLDAGEIGVNEASRIYGIPSRTLRRRRQTGIYSHLPQGPQGVLGIDNEKRLVKHVQRLEAAGFAPNRSTIRTLAFQFAEKLGVKHNFSKETGMAGHHWLLSFLERNPELSIRQAEGLSLVRGQGMSREEAKGFFDILKTVYEEHQLFDKPHQIFNIDESGVQLNNKPGRVIATKGAKDVHVLTSSERGENVTVIACCNAEGTFIPPVLIMKGVREKTEFSFGLPPGSKVFMNNKSSYINAELFLRWLKEQFLPRKCPGKTLLILDGHPSHLNSLELLEFTDENDILILCLPSHTTQALQPLDRSFFKPLKTFFKQEASNWMLHNKNRKISRLQAGVLIGKAWTRAASIDTATAGFRATGIYPLNPSAVPDHFFSISDISNSDRLEMTSVEEEDEVLNSDTPTVSRRHTAGNVVADTFVGPTNEPRPTEVSFTPSCSSVLLPRTNHLATTSTTEGNGIQNHALRTYSPTSELAIADQSQTDNVDMTKQTPTKHLMELSPIPAIPKCGTKMRKQSAELLSSEERKKKLASKKAAKTKTRKSSKKRKAQDDENDVSTLRISDSDEEGNEICVECCENYFQTKEKVDWIQCVSCKKWLHETCTMYGSQCNICGREAKRQKMKMQYNRNI